MPLRPGDILADKYRIERVLGKGGMGTVIAATHIDLQELRALKLMNPAFAENAHAIERFLREARAAVRIKSEHATRIFDVGRLDNNVPYIVMEHLTGSDLRELIARRGPLPVEEAVLYVLQACDALAEAHKLGIVHRDLKPSNLFLTSRPDGSPSIKLLDFGISKFVSSDDEPDFTLTHEILGSPFYMAPEQMRSGRSVDDRADIWALGIILYKLLTARLPFHGKGALEICAAVLDKSPIAPTLLRPDLPPKLEQVILRCLAKNPSERIASVPELINELLPFARARMHSEISIPVEIVDEFEPDEPQRISVQIVEEPETTDKVFRVKPGPEERALELQKPTRSPLSRVILAAFGLISSIGVVLLNGALLERHEASVAIEASSARAAKAYP